MGSGIFGTEQEIFRTNLCFLQSLDDGTIVSSYRFCASTGASQKSSRLYDLPDIDLVALESSVVFAMLASWNGCAKIRSSFYHPLS